MGLAKAVGFVDEEENVSLVALKLDCSLSIDNFFNEMQSSSNEGFHV